MCLKENPFSQNYILVKEVTFTFMHLADAFIQSDLLVLNIYSDNIFFFVSMCVPWELNPWLDWLQNLENWKKATFFKV